jgi:DNA replication protein DnaC
VPQLETLENFDWSFNPQIPKRLILDLGTVRFIPEHGGLLLLGPPGSGKSHIALSLTVAAIQAGYTALYRSAFDLAQDLAEAEATSTRPEFIRKLTRVDLLASEDLGMRLPAVGAECAHVVHLVNLVEDRSWCERGRFALQPRQRGPASGAGWL